MSVTYTIDNNLTAPGRSLQSSTTVAATGETVIDGEVVAAGATVSLAFPVDQSALAALYLLSDQDVTVTPTSPNVAIDLKADKGLAWESGGYYDCPLTADVTGLSVHNAGTKDATIYGRALRDATP